MFECLREKLEESDISWTIFEHWRLFFSTFRLSCTLQYSTHLFLRPVESMVSLHSGCLENVYLPVKCRQIPPVGSTSPCNSDDERKTKFIEKGNSFQTSRPLPAHYKHFERWRPSSDVSLWTSFPVKIKSRRFSKTVASDFGTVSPGDVLFSLRPVRPTVRPLSLSHWMNGALTAFVPHSFVSLRILWRERRRNWFIILWLIT